MSKRTPEAFLKQVFGRSVIVKLHSGSEYKGTLASMDALMNVVLENAQEYFQDTQGKQQQKFRIVLFIKQFKKET